MNALVTGGAGFIGSNVVGLLREKGCEVRVLDDLSTGYKQNLDGLDVEFVEGDVRDRDLVHKVMNGVDVVFHLAASVGNIRSLQHPQEDAKINTIGTVNILESARAQGVGRVVHSSSAAIFGELVTMPIAEDHPQHPDSPYGVSKLAAEQYVLCFAKLYGMSAVSLRYFNVYGVHQRYDAYGNVIPIFAKRVLSGKPLTIFGDGEQTRDFINVRDVAMANYRAATTIEGVEVFNCGSGRSITINRLAQLIQESAGVRAEIVHDPPRPGEVRHCRADITKLSEKLGLVPVFDIQSDLRAYLDWFRQDSEMDLG